MSDSLHPFGQHFRTWRKRRGLSLKEAAGDIVSPQFLSQFERGQKNISLTIFSRLLISIGVDWTDFILDYSGDRVDYAFSLLGENPNPSLVPTLKEELADYYQDNPLLKDIFLQAILALNTIHDPLENHASPKLQQLIKQVCRQPHPNTMEGDLFVMYRRQFPLAYVLSMRDHYHEKLNHALEARDLTSVHNSLISLNMIVDYFMANDYLVHCQELIDQLRELLKQSVYRFYQDFFIALILLESREVYLWLKQNKAEALTKARQILNMYDSMYDFSSDAYIKEYRSEFIKNVNRLNKTGKHIYED